MTIQYHGVALVELAFTPMTTATATATIASTTLATWNSLAAATSFFSRFLLSSSCSFAKATSEPQKEIEPMIAAKSDPTITATFGSCGTWVKPSYSMYSAHAMSATVPPPTPLKSATNCGIAVILVLSAGGMPSATPIARPMAISTQLTVGTPTSPALL